MPLFFIIHICNIPVGLHYVYVHSVWRMNIINVLSSLSHHLSFFQTSLSFFHFLFWIFLLVKSWPASFTCFYILLYLKLCQSPFFNDKLFKLLFKFLSLNYYWIMRLCVHRYWFQKLFTLWLIRDICSWNSKRWSFINLGFNILSKKGSKHSLSMQTGVRLN